MTNEEAIEILEGIQFYDDVEYYDRHYNRRAREALQYAINILKGLAENDLNSRNCGVKMNCKIGDNKSDSCYNCNKSYDMGCSECEKYCENEVTEQEVNQSCHL